jgi:hypothetical protein
MKKTPAVPILLSAILLVLALPGCVRGPEEATSFKTIFDHYRDREGVTAIGFPPGIVSLFLNESDPGQQELKLLMQQLSTFRMLSVEGDPASGGLSLELKDNVASYTKRGRFQDVFRMQSGNQDIFLKILETGGLIREAVLMLDEEGSFFVIYLKGNVSAELFQGLVEGGYLADLTAIVDMAVF